VTDALLPEGKQRGAKAWILEVEAKRPLPTRIEEATTLVRKELLAIPCEDSRDPSLTQEGGVEDLGDGEVYLVGFGSQHAERLAALGWCGTGCRDINCR
jgi:hypothetical protein